MEIKKSPKANLEDKKFLFTEIGLIVALLAVLWAFEWKSTEAKTLEALGLRKINQVVTKPDNAATRGMIYVVKHLVCVTEIK